MTEVIAKPFEDRPDYWEGRHMEVERTIRSMIELNCLGTNLCKMLSDDSSLREDYVNAVTKKILMHEWEQYAK
jgi:hypothetical protein